MIKGGQKKSIHSSIVIFIAATRYIECKYKYQYFVFFSIFSYFYIEVNLKIKGEISIICQWIGGPSESLCHWINKQCTFLNLESQPKHLKCEVRKHFGFATLPRKKKTESDFATNSRIVTLNINIAVHHNVGINCLFQEIMCDV